MVGTLVHGRIGTEAPSYAVGLGEVLRIVVVAGIPLGVVVGGIGSRLAMLLLRLTSPDSVRGTLTDDDFVVGEVTVPGTYNLLVLGAAVGLIGAAACIAVGPWLVGPSWLRATTVAVTAGPLVGSMVLHPEGRDLTVLEPTWLAAGLFVALPALFGWLMVYAVDRAARPRSRAGAGRWVLPAALVVPVAPALVVGVPVALVVAALLPLRRALLGPITSSPAGMLVVRAAFLVVPVLAALALWSDLARLD